MVTDPDELTPQEEYKAIKKERAKIRKGADELEDLIVNTLIGKDIDEPLEFIKREKPGDRLATISVMSANENDNPIFELAYHITYHTKQYPTKQVGITKVSDSYLQINEDILHREFDFNDIDEHIGFLKDIDKTVRAYKSRTLKIDIPGME